MVPAGGSDEPRLLFVYNADGGLANAARDAWHRLNSPQTYPCPLCKLTYGVRGMNPRWQRFLESLPLPVVFVHRDRFRADHAASSWRYVPLPVALLQRGRDLEELVSAEEFHQARTVSGLIARVQRAVDARSVVIAASGQSGWSSSPKRTDRPRHQPPSNAGRSA